MNDQEKRLRQRLNELQNQWNMLSDVIAKLDKDYIMETHTEQKIYLKGRLDERRAERNQVEEKLVDLESQIASIKKQESANRSLQAAVSQEQLSLATGVTLVYTLTGHRQRVNDLGWSPNGQWLASASDDSTIGLWDLAAGQSYFLEGHQDGVAGVSWSPDSQFLVSGANDQTVRIWRAGRRQPQGEGRKFPGQWINAVAWSPDNRRIAVAPDDRMIYVLDAATLQTQRILLQHEKAILRLAWSPDGHRLASASLDETACLWEADSGQLLGTLAGHGKPVTSVAWSPVAGRTVATASEDGTIHLWDTETGRARIVLEGHTGEVVAVHFAAEGRLLVSQSQDGTLRLWRTEDGLLLTTVPKQACHTNQQVAVHPKQALVAWSSPTDYRLLVARLEIEALLQTKPTETARAYRNAKVVLVGDTGVGKTGLSFVLSGQPYKKTDSTEGRRVVPLSEEEVPLPDGTLEKREILLWDLAGQPGYRLVHQLYLYQVAIALVVFDARSEIDPFAGVKYWDRALRQAHLQQGEHALPLNKILISARSDRGTLRVSKKRIDSFIEQYGFSKFIETSAKKGWGIPELINVIREAIAWEKLPVIQSNRLFLAIKNFLMTEKEIGHKLVPSDGLYHDLKNQPVPFGLANNLQALFDICVTQLDNADLIKKLSFGGLILLQPELLDTYASAIVEAAKDQPDGLGYIQKEKVINGDFRIATEKRIKDRGLERLLLIATVEELKRHEIAFEEGTDKEEAVLVFPSQLTRELPEAPGISGRSVVFTFEGAILSVYARLVVRLTRSLVFTKQIMWKDAVSFSWQARKEGEYRIHLHQPDDGCGEITLCFTGRTDEVDRRLFRDYVRTHLKRHVVPEKLQENIVVYCKSCNELIADNLIKARRNRGHHDIRCPVCESVFDLPSENIEEDFLAISKIDTNADQSRIQDVAKEIIRGKQETKSYDVFLCHNSQDKEAVKAIGRQLIEQGHLPWLDEWNLRPGFPWQNALEAEIQEIKSAAVFIGKSGIGPWQDMELRGFIREFIRRECPVIPVILKDCEKVPGLPVFLEGMTLVDFRKASPDPLNTLIWGISGKRPEV